MVAKSFEILRKEEIEAQEILARMSLKNKGSIVEAINLVVFLRISCNDIADRIIELKEAEDEAECKECPLLKLP